MHHDWTRRRVLRTTATVGCAGVAGCTDLEFGGDETPTSERSTLIATWRGNDPTRAVTLQWLASPSEPTEPVFVDLAAEGGSDESPTSATETDVTPFGESELVRHRAELTALEPDTRYALAVDNVETDLAVRTATAEPDGSLTFAEGGDVGTSAAVTHLHERAASWDPLFGLVGGDLAYADGEDEGAWVTFLEHWHEHMRSGDRLVPLVAAIGDHELKDREFYGTPADAPFFYTLFDNVQRERAYWALDIGEQLSILLLDSNHTAEVEGEQTAWLEEALAERRDRTHLMAAYHVPAFPSVKLLGDEERGTVRSHWVPVFEAHDVDVAFEHDDHAYKRTHRLRGGEPDADGVLYLGDGAWGQDPREVYSPDERPYLAVSESKRHVIRVDLEPDGSQRFRAIDPDGEPIDHLDVAEPPRAAATAPPHRS